MFGIQPRVPTRKGLPVLSRQTTTNNEGTGEQEVGNINNSPSHVFPEVPVIAGLTSTRSAMERSSMPQSAAASKGNNLQTNVLQNTFPIPALPLPGPVSTASPRLFENPPSSIENIHLMAPKTPSGFAKRHRRVSKGKNGRAVYKTGIKLADKGG